MALGEILWPAPARNARVCEEGTPMNNGPYRSVRPSRRAACAASLGLFAIATFAAWPPSVRADDAPPPPPGPPLEGLFQPLEDQVRKLPTARSEEHTSEL